MKPSFYIFMGMCVCVFLTLGAWQVKRLAWKESLLTEINKDLSIDAAQQQLTPDDMDLPQTYAVRRGYLKGSLDLSKSILWQGQISNGAPVDYIVAPFYFPRDQFIVPVVVGKCFEECNEISARTRQNIKIIGTLKRHRDNMFRPKNNIARNEWYRMDALDLSIQWNGHGRVRDVLFYAENNDIDPYLAPVQSVLNVPNNHKQYAFFWFAMAGLILSLTIYQFLQSRRPQ